MAIIAPLPSTILPGTLEDANQVQANFDWIVSQVNANVPGGGGGGGGRNMLFNGAMQVSQRLVATVKTLVPASGYTLDRWQGKSGAGGSAAFSQITGIVNAQFQYACRVQRTAANAAVTAIQLAQSLESVDSYPAQGRTVTISFWARSGGSFSPTGSLLNCAVMTGTGADENVLVGYTGVATGITTDVVLSPSWQQFQASGVLSSALTELGVVFTMTPTGTAGATDYFDVTGVQLELTTAASGYFFVGFGDDVAICQRYYQKSFPYATVPAPNLGGTTPIFLAVIAGANLASTVIPLPVALRTYTTAFL